MPAQRWGVDPKPSSPEQCANKCRLLQKSMRMLEHYALPCVCWLSVGLLLVVYTAAAILVCLFLRTLLSLRPMSLDVDAQL